MLDILSAFIIGAVIPGLMFVISKMLDYLSLKSEESRWYGEHLLKLRIDTLRELQLIMEEAYFTYLEYLNVSPVPEKDYFVNVSNKCEKYKDAKVISEMYLTNEQNEVLSAMLAQLRLADNANISECT